MLIFGIIAVSTNIMVGYTGLLSFGQASFFGIGAYACGLMLKAGFPLLLAIPAGTALATLVAAMVGYFCVKRTGLYFICLTFAFNQMFYFIAYVWTDVTGGEDGLPGILRPELISDSTSFYVFITVLFFACLLAMLKIVNSPLGLVFRLIRENPSRAAAIGYNVRLFKWISFIIASGFTGLAGTVYALLYSIVPIDQIHWLKSGDFIFMLLFGGTGHFFGPLIGAVGYIWLSDTFAIIWARWPLLMGGVFLIVVLYLRGGVVELIGKAHSFAVRRRGEIAT
jgi:branched-chain amino acid transport system permease protein